MESSKYAQSLKPGNYILRKGAWLRVIGVKPEITTVGVLLENSETLELGLELPVRFRTHEQQAEVEREEIVRETRKEVSERQSSQLSTPNRKNGGFAL